MIKTYPFKNRQVQDLAWVIASPPLISGNFNKTHWWSHQDCLAEFNSCLPALKALDNNPAPLSKHLRQLNSKRLGLYFEALVAYWFIISPNYKLLANSIQIIIDGHTFGEIDFIIQETHSQKLIHLEVAVKFYLGSNPFENPYRWFGTNTQDQLGRKVDHLKQHQTQLSIKYSYYLSKLGFHIDERHCLLKGRLFYPLTINTAPAGVTQNHLRGYWIQSVKKQQQGLYYPINKLNWLAEVHHDEVEQRLVQTTLDNVEQPTCYLELAKDSLGKSTEKNRIFVLPKAFVFPD